MSRSRIQLPYDEYKLLCRAVQRRDGWKCRVTLCKMRQNLHTHHIKFRSQGGDDASHNLITLCNDCHDALHNRYLVITPAPGFDAVDADNPKSIKWLFPNWNPNKRVR